MIEKIPNPYIPKLYVGEKSWKMLKKAIDNVIKKVEKDKK